MSLNPMVRGPASEPHPGQMHGLARLRLLPSRRAALRAAVGALHELRVAMAGDSGPYGKTVNQHFFKTQAARPAEEQPPPAAGAKWHGPPRQWGRRSPSMFAECGSALPAFLRSLPFHRTRVH